jgi:hypothetical protein
MMHNIRSIEEPPAELRDLVGKQDESLTNLSLHINKEKADVEKMISETQQSFVALTNKIKNSFIKELDAQVEVLNANFNSYKSMYSSFYRCDQVRNSEFPTLAEVMNGLNSANDKKELEILLKKLNEDVALGSSIPGTMEDKISQVKDKISNYAEFLKKQLNLKPSAENSVIEIRGQIEKILHERANYLENNSHKMCSNNIVSLIVPVINVIDLVDSVIITQEVVNSLIKSWLPFKEFKLRLLYRGSRDGYESTSFHNKCDNVQHTITIVENNFAKVIGGYSDQTWNALESPWKTSENTFLFSITNKETYPVVKSGEHHAIYAKGDFGPSFGWNFNFHIYNQCNVNTKSYVIMNNAYYETKGKTEEQYAGAKNFKVKEIEVLAVEYA